MAPRAKKKSKAKPVYPRVYMRCGKVTRASITAAAASERRKEGAFCRFVIEQWLQLNGHEVDQA